MKRYRCARCFRAMKPRPSGYGPSCEKKVDLIPEVERDLFGYDIPAAAARARETICLVIESSCADARIAIRNAAAAARRRLGVWSK